MNSLFPDTLAAQLPALYAQEEEQDPMMYVKFFHPLSEWAWYASEYDPGERLFFGFVVGDFPELGYFSLDELESTVVLGLGMERDRFFRPLRLSEVKQLHQL